ncbi:MAG: c-type cytochrome [Anaerolineae bacterium]|nr:c-type cytochrome [Anaerolineae bacterium]
MKNKKENYDRYVIIGLVLTLLTFVGFSITWLGENNRLVQASESFSEERIHRGRKVYNEQCASCHGAQGEGGVGPALNDRLVLKNTFDEVFFSVIRSGVPGTEMPAWSVDFGGPLTDEDVRDAVAYIRAWEPNAPEILPEVFSPNSAVGALFFESTCAICHGENGIGGISNLQGESIPAINNPERFSALDNDWYRATIRNGRPAKGMPTWGTVLSPEQIEHIIALIDTWRAGEEVQAAFSITDLLTSAVFSLSEEDPESALLHVSRAIKIAENSGADVLENASAQLITGDHKGAHATLTALKEQWPIGNSAIGGEYYAAKCEACHGVQGEGGIGTSLHPNNYIQEHTNSELVEFIFEGRVGTAMAGWEGRIVEQEAADIVAFLRTWQP